MKKLWQNYNQLAGRFFMLLLPGALTSLLIFFISSNRLLPGNKEATILLLNLLQLQMLGITIVKYGIDQMVLSRLQPGNTTMLGVFLKKRVLPLTFLFCIVVGIIKGVAYSVFFAVVLPLEVISIAISVELRVSNRYTPAFILTLLGYPFLFILIYFAYLEKGLTLPVMLGCFISSSVIRAVLALLLRNKGAKTAIAILSYDVPLQQVGNFIVFRFDQLVIAVGLGVSFLADSSLVGHYLFLAKFPEVCSGVIVNLAPVLYKRFGDGIKGSFAELLKDKFFLLFSAAIFISQLLICLLLFKPQHMENDLLLFFPFVISSLLILPANLVTYLLLKKGAVASINLLNLVSCVIGAVLFCFSLLVNNIYIFSLIVPVQLLVMVLLFPGAYRKGVDKEPVKL